MDIIDEIQVLTLEQIRNLDESIYPNIYKIEEGKLYKI